MHGLSCSAACGIFLEQGSNSCLLHWQAGSTTEPPGESSADISQSPRYGVLFVSGVLEAWRAESGLLGSFLCGRACG